MNATTTTLPSDSPLPPAAVRNRALKFRLYLSASQARRAAQWLWTAHAFRNTCVRLLEQMRWAGWQMQAYSRQRLPVDIRTALGREPTEGAAPAFFSGFNGWQFDDLLPSSQKLTRGGDRAEAATFTAPALTAWQYGLRALPIQGVKGNGGDEGEGADDLSADVTAHEHDSRRFITDVEVAHLSSTPTSAVNPTLSSGRSPQLLRTPTVDVLALQPFEEAFRERFMAGTAAIGLGYDASEASNPWGWSWEAGSGAHEPIWDLKAYTGQSVARVLNAFLTAHLTRARNRLPAILDGKMIPKAQIAEAFHDLWVGWSPQRRQEALLLARFDWLTVPRTILDQVIQDLVKTVSKANKDRSGLEASGKTKRKAGYPQPRAWNEAGSVRLQVNAHQNASFRRSWEQQELCIPGLGSVHFRDRGRRLPRQPGQMLTLARTATGKWYVSFPCSEADLWESFKHPKRVPPLLGSQPLPRGKEGLLEAGAGDAGLKNTMTTDEGKRYKTAQYLKRQKRRIRALNQNLSRKQKARPDGRKRGWPWPRRMNM